jgi:hypothetical protein
MTMTPLFYEMTMPGSMVRYILEGRLVCRCLTAVAADSAVSGGTAAAQTAASYRVSSLAESIECLQRTVL